MDTAYTIAELMLFPGINHKFISDCTTDLKLKPRSERIHGRDVLVFSREEFEKILMQKGYELVEIKGEMFWVRFRMKDLIKG